MSIDFDVADRIAKIVINRPEALNSMTPADVRRLVQGLD